METTFFGEPHICFIENTRVTGADTAKRFVSRFESSLGWVRSLHRRRIPKAPSENVGDLNSESWNVAGAAPQGSVNPDQEPLNTFNAFRTSSHKPWLIPFAILRRSETNAAASDAANSGARGVILHREEHYHLHRRNNECERGGSWSPEPDERSPVRPRAFDAGCRQRSPNRQLH